MNRWRKLLPTAILAAAPLLGGCWTTNSMLTLEEHPKQPVLLMDTDTRTYFWFFGTFLWNAEHIFWKCSQQGAEIQCVRACGGDSDLSCPTPAFVASWRR